MVKRWPGGKEDWQTWVRYPLLPWIIFRSSHTSDFKVCLVATLQASGTAVSMLGLLGPVSVHYDFVRRPV